MQGMGKCVVDGLCRWALFSIALAAACNGTGRPATIEVQILYPGTGADVDPGQCARDVVPDWPESWGLGRVNPAEDCVEYVPKT
jgi:hypothetical protein